MKKELIKFLIKEPNPASGMKSKHDKTIFENYSWDVIQTKLIELNEGRKTHLYYIKFGNDCHEQYSLRG